MEAAKIDVAEAQMKGEKLRDGQTLQNAAAGTKIVAGQGQGKKEEELKVTTDIVKVFDNQKEVALAKKAAQMAEVETRKAVAMREAQLEAQLQREVEKWNVLKRTEKLKAEYVTKVQEANWELYQKQKAAESYLYQKQKEAEAAFYAKQKEAEGLVAIAEAEGTYVRTLLSAFGGNYTAFRDYTMIKKGKYQEVAFGGAIDDDGAMKRKLGCFRRCLKLCTSKLGCFRRRGCEH